MIADERTLAAGVPVRRAAWQQGGRALLLGMAERRCAIRDRVALEDYAAVAVLSADFGVSAVTIRSDLGILEKQGAVRRVHGGAVRVTVRATRFQQFPDLTRATLASIFHRMVAAEVAGSSAAVEP